MKLIKDNNSKSLSLRLRPSVHQFNIKKILRINKDNKEDISRICLNSSQNDDFHQMIIFQTNKYKAEIKKNIRRDKSFILLHGKQIIRIYDKNKKIKKKIFLDKSNFLCWIKKNTYYDNICNGQKSVHIESLAGPFNKKKDHKYLR